MGWEARRRGTRLNKHRKGAGAGAKRGGPRLNKHTKGVGQAGGPRMSKRTKATMDWMGVRNGGPSGGGRKGGPPSGRGSRFSELLEPDCWPPGMNTASPGMNFRFWGGMNSGVNSGVNFWCEFPVPPWIDSCWFPGEIHTSHGFSHHPRRTSKIKAREGGQKQAAGQTPRAQRQARNTPLAKRAGGSEPKGAPTKAHTWNMSRNCLTRACNSCPTLHSSLINSDRSS